MSGQQRQLKKPILYYSRDCTYSRVMLEMLVKTNARGEISCVCVDTQESKVPRFVTCTPAIYLPDEKKLLKNSAVKSFVVALTKSVNSRRGGSAAAAATAATVQGSPPSDIEQNPEAENAPQYCKYSCVNFDNEEDQLKNEKEFGTTFVPAVGDSTSTTTATAGGDKPQQRLTAATVVAPPKPKMSKSEQILAARMAAFEKARNTDYGNNK